MNSKLWIRKAFSSCLIVALTATYSLVALASPDKASAELIVLGKTTDALSSFVSVNGEQSKSGRTIFSDSTIIVPENASAKIDMGKAGEIELSAGSNALLSFDKSSASIELVSGTVMVVRSVQAVNVNAGGSSQNLYAGQSASAGTGKDDHDYRDANGKCVDANKNGKLECGTVAGAWWLWAIVFGGAAVGIVAGVSQSNNDFVLGGAGTVVSPTR